MWMPASSIARIVTFSDLKSAVVRIHCSSARMLAQKAKKQMNHEGTKTRRISRTSGAAS
jgi:hypothetical protein